MEKNSCSCSRNQRHYGVLSALNSRSANCASCSDNRCGCRATTTCPECTTCAGSSLFYTGQCGKCRKNCGCSSCNNGNSWNNCNNCNSCDNCNNCNSCNECSECYGYSRQTSWNDIPLSRVSADSVGCSRCENNVYRRYNEEKSCSSSNVYGVFTAACPITACDGEIIAMEMESGENSHFRESGGCVHIMRDGTYEVIYSLNLPAQVQASSCLALSLDGQRIYHSAAPVESCGAQHTSRFTGHGVICARRGQRLALHADGGLEIPGNYGNFPAAQLTITRVG